MLHRIRGLTRIGLGVYMQIYGDNISASSNPPTSTPVVLSTAESTSLPKETKEPRKIHIFCVYL